MSKLVWLVGGGRGWSREWWQITGEGKLGSETVRDLGCHAKEVNHGSVAKEKHWKYVGSREDIWPRAKIWALALQV